MNMLDLDTYAFNSLYWIPTIVNNQAILSTGVTFNSLYWIHTDIRERQMEMPRPANFQFFVLDSVWSSNSSIMVDLGAFNSLYWIQGNAV